MGLRQGACTLQGPWRYLQGSRDLRPGLPRRTAVGRVRGPQASLPILAPEERFDVL